MPRLPQQPAPPERVFAWHDHAALWFSLGVGLLVMQVGAYLAPTMGTREALFAVVVGSVIGAGLLAWVAQLACASGRTSAGLMQQVYGAGFGRLPMLLNVLQLLGWATFELVVMRDGTRAIARGGLGVDPGLVGPTLLWGGLLLLLLRVSMLTLVRRVVSRIGLPLVVLSLLWLTWRFAAELPADGLRALWERTGDGSMNTFQALDLVVAMPVSWLPLVADYARHGRSARGALAGTWIGYVVANIWCYALGVLVIMVVGAQQDLVAALLLAQGGLIALGLILIDEVDNAYGDLYSGSVSLQALLARATARTWATWLALLATAFALTLPMRALEPFLLLLSSVFVPLFGVMLGWLATAPLPGADTGAKVRWWPAGLWMAGVVLFHALGQWASQWGSALPTLAITFVAAAACARWTTLRALRVHAGPGGAD